MFCVNKSPLENISLVGLVVSILQAAKSQDVC